MNQVSKSYAIRGKKEVHGRMVDRGYNEEAIKQTAPGKMLWPGRALILGMRSYITLM